MIRRYSSRTERLGASFLAPRLAGAASYDRIAGYFCSSMLEIAGEALESLSGKARILCNSGVSAADAKVAALAQQGQKIEWSEFRPEEKFDSPEACARMLKLHELLVSEKVEIRVLPDEVYGLMHGKAGVIRQGDGSATCFMGSMNETKSAFALNYEIVWEDDDPAAVAWVQEEFDAFWNDTRAVPLGQFVVNDLERLGKRKAVPLADWKRKAESDPEGTVASAVAEEPVVRREYGLWEHQKYFVLRAFREHGQPEGARLLLADMVGLGKTLQLAMSAKLMALTGSKPVLVIVPKTLMNQWQMDEFLEKLDCPTAVWTGRNWRCEDKTETLAQGAEGILACPRRIGIVSQGLITRGAEAAKLLLGRRGGYECVILDEAHRARRQNLGKDPDTNHAQPNKLMRFMLDVSEKTHSLLLATATPVQLHPIEAFDLLSILSGPSHAAKHVLGDDFSEWIRSPQTALEWVSGGGSPGSGDATMWSVMRNPFPAPVMSGLQSEWSNGVRDICDFRNRKHVHPDDSVLSQGEFDRYLPPEKGLLRRIWGRDGFLQNQNPYVRTIVRRTRDYLERTINPETNRPYLERIEVVLYGEKPDEALPLAGYFEEAYRTAEEFCRLLSKRAAAGGFMTTMLLKRIGSTMLAGERTARKMLDWGEGVVTAEDVVADAEDDDENEVDETAGNGADVRDVTQEEVALLRRLVDVLGRNGDEDPKYLRIREVLRDGVAGEGGWADKGCILFSQFYDSAEYVAARLSRDFRGREIGLYAGGTKSGVFCDGVFTPAKKDELKKRVSAGSLSILVGTDAASEGLNLQRLGTLINIDLPWNPTRLEQRKGRIQRIGQTAEQILLYNLRYKGSVEDRVHERLSERLEEIHSIFGQIPDVLDDVWIGEALGDEERAKTAIRNLPRQNPFVAAYETEIPPSRDWNRCTDVLSKTDKNDILSQGW